MKKLLNAILLLIVVLVVYGTLYLTMKKFLDNILTP